MLIPLFKYCGPFQYLLGLRVGQFGRSRAGRNAIGRYSQDRACGYARSKYARIDSEAVDKRASSKHRSVFASTMCCTSVIFGVWPDPTRVDKATRRHDGAGDFPVWLGDNRRAPRPTLFIKGNHEDFVWLDSRPDVEVLPGLAGGGLSSIDVSRLLHISRQAVDKRRREGKLLAVPRGSDYAYPACQFEDDRTVAGLPEMLAARHVNHPWATLAFLVTPADELGCSPLQALQQHDPKLKDHAIRLARAAAGGDGFG